MKIFSNENKNTFYNKNKKYKVVTLESVESPIKTYYLDIPDSTTEYNDIKIALDETIEMEVGDDLGICVHLLPHEWSRTNPFKLTTSDKNVVDIDGYILTAKKTGIVTITATTMNDLYTDSITVNVKEKYEFVADELETYILEPERFNLIEHTENNDPCDKDIAFNNSNAIKAAIIYAKAKEYKKIIFPNNKTYYYDPSYPIYLKNDLIIDLNGSTLQVFPNYFFNGTSLYFEENCKMVNVCPRGWKECGDSIGRVTYKDTYWQNENGGWVWSYVGSSDKHIYEIEYPNGGEIGELTLNGIIPVIENEWNLDNENQYKNFIEKPKTYKGFLTLLKLRDANHANDNYTNNNIKIIMDCYKNEELITSKEVSSSAWQKSSRVKNISFNFDVINIDCNKLTFRITGLSDLNFPIKGFVSNLDIYEYTTSNMPYRNMVIENGSILGDRYLKDSDEQTYKDKIFKDLYGVGWSSFAETEGTLNMILNSGNYSGCRNMTIGNTIGFNIGIGYGVSANSYYMDANRYTLGGFDDNGKEIDKEKYARNTIPYKVDISKTPYFTITDPTFQTTYYFGFRSRILDVYFYDKDMNFLKCLKGKFRHGLLKAPENTQYINISIPLVTGESLPTAGHSDFGNCILAVKFMYPTNKCFFKNCEIMNNYSCGMAHSGLGVLVEDCYFHNNVGRMPWADVDSEDGWVRMQNNVFRNNSFNSYYGFIMCSGTNYVLKNNTFNCPVKIWPDCQYYKILNNTFKNQGYVGAGGLGTMADMYVVSNLFEENLPINSTIKHSGADYRVYFANNICNGSFLSLANNQVTCLNNKLIGNIGLLLKNDTIIDNKGREYFKDISFLTLSDSTPTYNNIDFGTTKLKLKQNTTHTFNNCKFDVLPSPVTGATIGKAIFNDCTIINPKISDSFTYNNCNFITKILDEYIVDGIVKDGLIFAQPEASGKYSSLQDTVISRADGSYTISVLCTKINNFNFNAIDSDYLYLSGGAAANSVSVKIWYTNDNNETRTRYMWAASAPGKPVAETDSSYVLTITFDYEKMKFSLYINSVLTHTYSIPSGYVAAKTSNIKINGQCTAVHYYAYDRLLSQEELEQNWNTLMSLIK